VPKTIATSSSWYWPEGIPRVVGVPPRDPVALALARERLLGPDRIVLSDGVAALSAAELEAGVAAAAATAPGSCPLRHLYAAPSVEGALEVLGVLAAGIPVVLAPDDEDVRAPAERAPELPPPAADGPGTGLRAPLVAFPARGALAWHSPRSLLASALGLLAFLEPAPGARLALLAPPSRWDGLCALLVGLLAGTEVVLVAPGDAARELLEAGQVDWAVASLDEAAATFAGAGGRRRRPGARDRYLLATVEGPFDPDERRAVAAGSGLEALTLFGLPETGPVLGAHPSWYLEEAVGIPLPNQHVLPADPDTGEPLAVMWELLEQAMISVWSPALAVAGVARAPGVPRDERVATGVFAASDPNGMLYLLEP
jgi:hypothetical protein